MSNSPLGKGDSVETVHKDSAKFKVTWKSAIRKALENVQQKADDDLNALEEKIKKREDAYGGTANPYTRDILNLARTLLSTSYGNTEQKEEALRHIGHLAYTGGYEAAKVATIVLPHMLDILKNQYSPVSIRIQVLKTLSEVCHRNQDAVKLIKDDSEILGFLNLMIDDDPRMMRETRWAIYLLWVCAADDIAMLKLMRGMRELSASLKRAGKFKGISWTGWGGNLAKYLLDLMAVSYSERRHD